MQIVAALFIENIELKPAPGPSTRIDLAGIHFSRAADGPVPCTVAPHLVVLVHCPPDEPGTAALEVTYHRDGEQIARNVQPLQVEPGKFNYRLVRAELEFEEYGAVQAHVRIDLQEPMVVPFTLLPPVEGEAPADDALDRLPLMPFAVAVSEHPVPAEAVGEVLGDVLEQVGPRPDVALVVVTGPLVGTMEDVASAVRSVLDPGVLVGCTAVSVVAGTSEVEDTAAVALWAGRLDLGPDEAPPRGVQLAVTPDRFGGYDLVGTEALHGSVGTLVLLAEPFSFPVDDLLRELELHAPDLTVVGGLASAARGPGGNRMVLDGSVGASGAVGILFPPGPRITTLVSQGCRPVGDPFTVTDAAGRMVRELGGRPAYDRLNEVAQQASPETRAQMAKGLQLGVVIDEQRDSFSRGDFLIRNLVGVDRDNGALAVGDEVAVGTTVQFQVRDAETADEDLSALLADLDRAADGALLFTCSGRGEQLFGRPDHDATEVADHLVDQVRPAVGGLFCAGEIGPVGSRNLVHAFTASVALFHDPVR